MAKVIFELTAAEKQQLEADFKALGCGSLLTLVDHDLFRTANFGRFDPDEKRRYRCEEVPALFFHYAPKWKDCILHCDPWVAPLGGAV